MPEVIKNMLSSKKFIFVLLVSVLTVTSAHYGVITKPETLAILTLVWPMYLGAQGLADIGDKLGQWKAEATQIRADSNDKADAQHNATKMNIISSIVPVFLEVVKMQGAKIPRTPAPLLKKGQKVLHFDLGPDKVGIVQHDQIEGDPVMTIRLEGEEKNLICLACDLVVVPDDFVPPKTPGGSVKHQGTA